MPRPVVMPRTGHEILMRLFPFMDEMVAEDVAYIRQAEPETRVVSMSALPEGLPHGFKQVFDTFLGWKARREAAERGMSFDEAERQFRFYMSVNHSEALAHSIQMEYCASLNFRLNGEKVFHLSEPLTERLAHTEANLLCEHLRLPFPSFQILYTSKLAIDLYHNHIGQDGFRLGDRRDIDYEAPLSVFVTRLPPGEEDEDTLLITTFQMREVPREGPAIRAVTNRQLNLDPAWDLEAAIRTDWKKIDASKGVVRSRGQDAGSSVARSDETFYQQGYGFYRLVMNTILYLTSKNAEREALPPASRQMLDAAADEASSKRRRQMERKARFASDAPFEFVGRSVTPIAFGEGRQREGSAGDATGRKIERRFLVRGHWRSQAAGPGWSERRTIFIEPYYKGPDISEEISRPYLVRQDGRRIVGGGDDD